MKYEIQRPLPYGNEIRWIRAWGYHRSRFEANNDTKAIDRFRHQIVNVKVPMRLIRIHPENGAFNVVLTETAQPQFEQNVALISA